MFYKICRLLFIMILKIISRYQVSGCQNLPESGPALVVSNHLSNWDPLIIGVALPRQINFVAKEVLFKIPLVGLLLRTWGAIPINRGRGDREALAKSMELLKAGRVVGIFIEGKRNLVNPDQMLKPKPGAAMLALKSGAPVVPVALANTNRILRSFKKVKVIIGKPMTFSSTAELEGLEKKDQYSQISKEITAAIEGLYRQIK